ncbi:MotA/TolQ/ExbB proton channel family protein [Aquimarina brevivitae]|uniref:MotA/TolQ/ExbB proton channel family protein n=1 Tax=Aquimarina brevivitae TaxID=323412 RepID=A0A4Q7NZS9_9FLAO|nr:MotA/TolQ/ExbB proton channel family protein [Aquimarina brevivitae]RZS92570.1 MotA/TolQ/ExbB proton channel family protein [Aquimarina brevivitae]
MIKVTIVSLASTLLFIPVVSLLEEGGLFFMIPLLLLLVLSLFLIARAGWFIAKKDTVRSEKYSKLINSIGLLALVWGMLGQLIGVIGMFDSVEKIGEISTHIFAAGLKVSALPPVFGFVVFIVTRIATIILTWLQSEKA